MKIKLALYTNCAKDINNVNSMKTDSKGTE